MKNTKNKKMRTKIILLIPGAVALVSLVLCLVYYPYRHREISDGDLCFYYDTVAITQWYRASLPETAIDVRVGDRLLLFSGIDGKCDTIMYEAVNDSVYRFGKKDTVGVKVFLEYIPLNDSNDTNKTDSLLTLLVNRCLDDSAGYAFCGIMGDTLTFIRHDQLPGFTFDSAMLRQKLLNDTDYAFYGNVYAFLMGEKILEAYESPDRHTYGKDDFTADEGRFLCSVNRESLEHKPITVRGNTIWIIFSALFIYSILIIIFYLIFVKRKDANNINVKADEIETPDSECSKADDDNQAEMMDKLNTAVALFNESPKDLIDFIKFAHDILEEEFPDAEARAKLLGQAEDAAKRFGRFLKESEISSVADMDALSIYDFVSRLYVEHSKVIAEMLGYKSIWFEKADVLMARLGILVGCYGLCKNLNDAYLNKTECGFGEEVGRFAKDNKLLADYKKNLESAVMDSHAQRETDMFVKTMNDRFVAKFRDNVHDKDDMGWFFEYVLNIAFHSADFISYMSVRNQNIIYFPNYNWLVSGFDNKDVKKYVYHDARYSTVYADRIYEWLEKVDVRHTDFLIETYKLKP